MPLSDVEKRKAYHKKYHAAWYQKPANKAKQKAKAKSRRVQDITRNREYVLRYKQEHGCKLCPENDPCCLDFHHCRGKKVLEVSIMVTRYYSLKRIKAEIEKCDLLCRNCHAKLHDRERKGRLAQRPEQSVYIR